MGALVSELLAIGLLIWIIRFALTGKGRIGRPPRGIGTRLRSPTDAPVGAAVLGGYALGHALTRTDPSANVQGGIMIGGVLAMLLAFRLVERYAVLALGVVGFVLAVEDLADVIRGGEYDGLASTYRSALMLLVLACFAGAIVLFDRASALRGERGLALLGIVDILAFITRPTGADMFDLSMAGEIAFLIAACAIAFGLGFAASEATLGLVGIVVVALTLLEGRDVIAVAAATASFGFTSFARSLTNRVHV